jgi:hypothetical protein
MQTDDQLKKLYELFIYVFLDKFRDALLTKKERRSYSNSSMAKEAGSNGIFIGSTILKLHDDKPALVKMIQKLKEQC